MGVLKQGEFTRTCPRCGKTVRHTTKKLRDHAVRAGCVCRSCAAKVSSAGEKNGMFGRRHSTESLGKMKDGWLSRDLSYLDDPEYRKKLSAANGGTNNRMAGISLFDYWVRKHGPEEAKRRDAAWRAKQSENSRGTNNPMYGRPSPSRSGNGWKGWYKGKYFRSIRELTMMVMLDRDGTSWKSAENIVIDYLTPLGTLGTYRPDFLVEDTRLIEVKPKRLWHTPKVAAKKVGAEYLCQRKGWTYELVDPKLLEPTEFAALRRSGDLVFDQRYEAKFLAKYGDMA